MPHPADFQEKHKELKSRSAVCARCHGGEQFCNRCHHGNVPTIEGWLAPTGHPALAGKKGAEGCFGCHDPRFCAACHTRGVSEKRYPQARPGRTNDISHPLTGGRAMSTGRLTEQLVCSMPTRVGLLADVAEAMRQAGVNIMAISAYEREGEGKFLMVTDDNAKATEAMARLGAKVRARGVVAVEMPNRVGALDDVARKIAEAAVNIDYVYGTGGGAETATVIFATGDDDEVVELINR